MDFGIISVALKGIIKGLKFDINTLSVFLFSIILHMNCTHDFRSDSSLFIGILPSAQCVFSLPCQVCSCNVPVVMSFPVWHH